MEEEENRRKEEEGLVTEGYAQKGASLICDLQGHQRVWHPSVHYGTTHKSTWIHKGASLDVACCSSKLLEWLTPFPWVQMWKFFLHESCVTPSAGCHVVGHRSSLALLRFLVLRCRPPATEAMPPAASPHH
jgi:hypothetical protein